MKKRVFKSPFPAFLFATPNRRSLFSPPPPHHPANILQRLLASFASSMAVKRASHNWAYSEDIPGSRCGPEDGPWPRAYQVLEENELWRDLRVLARPHSLKLESEPKLKVDSINFQPSPTTKTQDRYVVTQLHVHGRRWTFTGVFDGELAVALFPPFAYRADPFPLIAQVIWAMSQLSMLPIICPSSCAIS
jgi:hypothetical protein